MVAPHAFEAIVFITVAPTFQIRDGLCHITQEMGGIRFERVMQISLLRKTIRNAQKALADFERYGSAEVIDFPVREEGNGH